MVLKRSIFLILLLLCCTASAFPGFDPFTSAAGSGGTSYAPGAGLYHQTNAMLEGWSLWNGGSGSSSAQVTCVASNLVYLNFPAGFPAPPAAGVSLPGTGSDVSGYSAALQFSRAISADPNGLATNKVYASFLLQIPNIGNLSSGSPIYFGGFATNSGDQNIALPSRALKLFLKGNSGTVGASVTYSIGIQNASGSGANAAYDAGGHSSNDVLFVVMDYEFGVGGAPDVANLWVDPPSGSFATAVPPPTASFSASTASAQLGSAADFFLLARSGSTLWGSLLLGDLRIGDTWSYVTGAPEITVPPSNQTNFPGSTAVFAAQAVAGATNISPLVYQWQFDGTNLSDGEEFSGSTSPALSLSNVTMTNAGVYSIVVSNSLASVTNSADLDVLSVSITTNPVSRRAVAGGSATFNIAAVGIPTLAYQWQEDGTNLTNGVAASGTAFSGVNTPTLTLQNISYADSGSAFVCVVTNEAGAGAVSSAATLTAADPILVSMPQAQTVSPGGTASFSVLAAGSGPFSYQWQNDGIPLMDGLSPSGALISGADTTNLQVVGAGYSDAGNYSVTVFNAYNAAASSPSAALTVVYTNLTTPICYANVKTFGAKGDGVADDTIAFEEAIAAAISGTNDGVYVPPGRYVISAPLTLNALEMLGRFAGGWAADTAPLPTLLIRQYDAPGLSLTNGASLCGLAIDYDEGTPTATNAPAISVQSVGTTLSDLRIQNAYDGISTPAPDMPGRARYSDIMIIQPAHNGIEISKCYDFVQFRDIEVVCPGAMSSGAAFSFGRVDEGGYAGLMASNCATGFQFLTDPATNGNGGFFTGGFAGCSAIDCQTDVWVCGDHKIKISGGNFTASACGAYVDGTNAEFTMAGGRWQANSNQAVQVAQAANVVLDADMFCRAAPVSNTLVQVQNCAMVTVKDCQFLPGSTGLELDDQNQQAMVYGNNFQDGEIINNLGSNDIVAANLFTASPPCDFQAIAGNGQVTLSWAAPLGATGYNLQRATASGGPYTTIASLTATNDTDSSVTNGTVYYYVVSALRSGTESANSSQVSATPALPAPAPPSGLTATPGNGQVVLTWTPSSGATNYEIEQSLTSGGPYTWIAATSGISYTNAGLTNGVAYYFVVTAANPNGISANSVEASATPQVPLPIAPAGLAATASNGQIQLTWNAVSGAANYYLKRATSDGGPYAIIAEVPQPAWNDPVVNNGVTYYYVVSAVNAAGQSGNSPQVAVVITPSITLFQSSGNLLLSWPAWASGYGVNSTTNLVPPIVWIPVTNAPQSNNGVFYLNLPATNNTAEFYRLSAPQNFNENIYENVQ
ncbi:MAG TPA: immunoglobulin domain-containing protein [Candidatus Sulfotelmatobacter sp.]|nr:immunoglobulin domain-containing protein [Candidatus Sulfotelmatobacter sp.]